MNDKARFIARITTWCDLHSCEHVVAISSDDPLAVVELSRRQADILRANGFPPTVIFAVQTPDGDLCEVDVSHLT